MGRKDVLKGLMEAPSEIVAPPARVDAARPRYTTGAIGAVSKSIAELKSRAVIDVDPRMIDNAGFQDRLDADDSDLGALTESIRQYGQQVPVLLRPNPNDAERFQVVYGRRRVAALNQLHQPVKALVRIIDDHELVIAQGQENAARKDLSFIERANFARQMRDGGYKRKVICDALHVDKTLISRMLSVADRVPTTLIEAIGAAPSVGRDRWLALADMVEKNPDAAAANFAKGNTSDQRFDQVVRGLSTPDLKKQPTEVEILHSKTGHEIGTIKQQKGRAVISIISQDAKGFDGWIVKNIRKIHLEWEEAQGD